MTNLKENESQQAAANQPSHSLLSETWYFLKHNKKWWLVPFILTLLAVFSLLLLSGGGLAPFIYLH